MNLNGTARTPKRIVYLSKPFVELKKKQTKSKTITNRQTIKQKHTDKNAKVNLSNKLTLYHFENDISFPAWLVVILNKWPSEENVFDDMVIKTGEKYPIALKHLD